jgi:mRNA interferase MazF
MKGMDTLSKFIDWIKLKMALDSISYKPPLVDERDIWWISFGKNIGSEINGKSRLFSRPGIVLKKLSSKFYLVAPTTSKEHTGSWYVKITYSNKQTYVCLHQIRTLDYRRLSNKIGQIDDAQYNKIKDGFLDLYK